MATKSKKKISEFDLAVTVPTVLVRRAERIVGASAAKAYRVTEDNSSLLRVILTNGDERFVDIDAMQEVAAEDVPDVEIDTTQTKKVKADDALPKRTAIKQPKETTRSTAAAANDTTKKPTRKKSRKSTRKTS